MRDGPTNMKILHIARVFSTIITEIPLLLLDIELLLLELEDVGIGLLPPLDEVELTSRLLTDDLILLFE